MESKTRSRCALVAIRRVFRRGFTGCGGWQICRCGQSQSTAMYRHREYQRSSAQLKRRKSQRRCNNSWLSAMSRTDPIGSCRPRRDSCQPRPIGPTPRSCAAQERVPRYRCRRRAQMEQASVSADQDTILAQRRRSRIPGLPRGQLPAAVI